MSVSAVITTWKRQYNVPMIVEDLLKYSFISEIIIVDHSKCENLMAYGRFTNSLRAKNDIIYSQDDDCIVHNVQGIYDKFMEDQTKIAYSGIEGYENKIETYGNKQLALLGWGSIFSKDMIGVLDKYIQIYGKDECFIRESDRIFTLLQNKHHNFVAGGITHLQGKDNLDALCQQSDHVSSKNIAIERCLKIK